MPPQSKNQHLAKLADLLSSLDLVDELLGESPPNDDRDIAEMLEALDAIDESAFLAGDEVGAMLRRSGAVVQRPTSPAGGGARVTLSPASTSRTERVKPKAPSGTASTASDTAAAVAKKKKDLQAKSAAAKQKATDTGKKAVAAGKKALSSKNPKVKAKAQAAIDAGTKALTAAKRTTVLGASPEMLIGLAMMDPSNLPAFQAMSADIQAQSEASVAAGVALDDLNAALAAAGIAPSGQTGDPDVLTAANAATTAGQKAQTAATQPGIDPSLAQAAQAAGQKAIATGQAGVGIAQKVAAAKAAGNDVSAQVSSYTQQAQTDAQAASSAASAIQQQQPSGGGGSGGGGGGDSGGGGGGDSGGGDSGGGGGGGGQQGDDGGQQGGGGGDDGGGQQGGGDDGGQQTDWGSDRTNRPSRGTNDGDGGDSGDGGGDDGGSPADGSDSGGRGDDMMGADEIDQTEATFGRLKKAAEKAGWPKDLTPKVVDIDKRWQAALTAARAVSSPNLVPVTKLRKEMTALIAEFDAQEKGLTKPEGSMAFHLVPWEWGVIAGGIAAAIALIAFLTRHKK